MAGKGSAPGERRGGRTAGTPNKRTAARETVIATAKITPLEYMLGVLNDNDAEPRDRAWAANAAAPYVHAKLASVEVGNKPGETFKVGLLSEDGGLL
jgi:hypothetical protein